MYLKTQELAALDLVPDGELHATRGAQSNDGFSRG
jgi:hypothetical protein